MEGAAQLLMFCKGQISVRLLFVICGQSDPARANHMSGIGSVWLGLIAWHCFMLRLPEGFFTDYSRVALDMNEE